MSGGEMAEWLGAMRELLFDMQREAEEMGYGFFPGGDPRTFTPDPEASTPEEQAKWKEDCARAERGEKPLTETRCRGPVDGDPQGTLIVTPSGYGLGAYTIEDPRIAEIAERLERIVGQAEAWARDREGDQ